MMKKIIEALMIILIFVCSNQINAQDSESTLMSVEEYIKKLTSIESERGELFCKKDGKRYNFSNCKDFIILQEQGCYGYTTREMGVESRYTNTCNELEAITQASVVNTDYFELNSPDWWQSLPAEIIPMTGGIYSDESWAREKSELDKLV